MNNAAKEQVEWDMREQGWIAPEDAEKLQNRLLELAQTIKGFKVHSTSIDWTDDKTRDVLDTLIIDIQDIAGEL
jgi:hypothetical protein